MRKDRSNTLYYYVNPKGSSMLIKMTTGWVNYGYFCWFKTKTKTINMFVADRRRGYEVKMVTRSEFKALCRSKNAKDHR